MWRVMLSVVAVVFDVLMLLLLGLAVIGLLAPTPHEAAPQSDAALDAATHTASLIVVGVLITGVVLNMLAIGFGARIGPSRRITPAIIAAEFS